MVGLLWWVSCGWVAPVRSGAGPAWRRRASPGWGRVRRRTAGS